MLSITFRGGLGAGGEGREEVHLQGLREAGRRAEGDVHVAVQDLHHVRTRNLHPLRQRTVVQPKLLHPANHRTKKDRTSSVYAFHSDDKCIKIYTPRQERKSFDVPARNARKRIRDRNRAARDQPFGRNTKPDAARLSSLRANGVNDSVLMLEQVRHLVALADTTLRF